jgi:lipopolysaccharide/colanic/teichoic acid biosynthesis glycosyltransferase
MIVGTRPPNIGIAASTEESVMKGHVVDRVAEPVRALRGRRMKRAADVAGALGMLVMTAPVMLAAAAAIRLTSAGAALYKQTRVGAGGREFCLLKLRTMVLDAERETGPVMAAPDDTRITAVGRVLRAMRIDELPQLVNVLRGEMSLVGPRPERPHFVRMFMRRVPGYGMRHAVRPGMTGMAQVCGDYATAPERKLEYDLMYIRTGSMALDAEIFLRTIRIVLRVGRDAAGACVRSALMEASSISGK